MEWKATNTVTKRQLVQKEGKRHRLPIKVRIGNFDNHCHLLTDALPSSLTRLPCR